MIADSVIAHLSGVMGADVRLTLEIEVDIPDGTPEQVVRIVTENSRTLNFDDSGSRVSRVGCLAWWKQRWMACVDERSLYPLDII